MNSLFATDWTGVLQDLHVDANCHLSDTVGVTDLIELMLQAPPTSLIKRTSAEGSQLTASGLATQGSAESTQPNTRADPGMKSPDADWAASSALLQTDSIESKDELSSAMPMEVDDDAMFQKKPAKAVKPDASEVSNLFSLTCVAYHHRHHHYPHHHRVLSPAVVFACSDPTNATFSLQHARCVVELLAVCKLCTAVIIVVVDASETLYACRLSCPL